MSVTVIWLILELLHLIAPVNITKDYQHHTYSIMALVVPDKNAFQHILRLLNTNVDGKEKVMFALTRIKGVGRRYSNIVIKKVHSLSFRT